MRAPSPPEAPTSLFPFWRSCVKSAGKKVWQQLGLFNQLGRIIAALLLLGAFANLVHPLLSTAQQNFWLVISPPALCVLFSLFHLFKAPWERYRELETKSESEKQALESEANRDRTTLLAEIESLKARLDDTAKRKFNTEMMGLYMIGLQDRATEVRKIIGYQYDDEARKTQEKESLDLINRIVAFLQENVGSAQAALFRSHATPISSPIPNDERQEGMFTDRYQAKQRCLDLVNHHERQLADIIKGYH